MWESIIALLLNPFIQFVFINYHNIKQIIAFHICWNRINSMWCYLSSLVLTKYHHAYALFASINVQNLPIWMLKFNLHTISDGKQKRWNCLVSQMIVSLFIESAKFLRKMSGKMIDIFILRHIIGPNGISLPNSNRILYRPKNVSHSHIFFNDFCITRKKHRHIL